MKKFNEELLKFLENGTTTFTCIKIIKDILLENNYLELTEFTKWNLKPGKYFVIRNNASIIAFNIAKNYKEQFKIVETHSDTPAFLIKPNPDYYENGYLKLNVAPYGGILNYGYMDRPLSIAGRLILKKDQQLITKIIDIKDTIALIPSMAIHQNDKANVNLDLNTEVDLMPIISLNKKQSLTKLIKEKLKIKDSIYDFDLLLYNNELPIIINNEFIASPRIDNLTCTYAALKAFLNKFNEGINILTIFNSEEIGSNTYEGADSNFLIDTLTKICENFNLDISTTLAKSLVISADNTHARHPNHDELSDHSNTPILDDGVLIIRETNGTTTGLTASIFKKICEDNNIKWTYYTSRNDFYTGGTQAGASLKHLSTNSLDIGLPMLAMHSSMELIGINDTYRLSLALTNFYNYSFDINNNKINF